MHRFRFILIAILPALFAAGAGKGSAQSQPPAAAAPAEGTSRSAALDRLFEMLGEAPSFETGRGVEQLIWAMWLKSGDDEVDRLLGRSIEAMNRFDYPSALSHLDRIVALAPDYAEGWNKRATVHFLAGDYARSVSDIEHVLRIEPRHFGALAGLGMILDHMGRKKEALEIFRRTLAVHPQLPAVRGRVDALALDVEGQET